MSLLKAYSCGVYGALKLASALGVALVRPSVRLLTAFVRHDFPLRY
jgi:hypothetical protein